MNTLLWIIQALLAAAFVMPGIGKIGSSRQKHIEDGHITAEGSVIPLRVLGVLELLGCTGMIVPWLTGIAPVLTPVAALCFCLVMLAGIAVHIKKKEYKMLPLLIVIFGLAAFVAYYRMCNLIG